jgi:uncharacterized protein (TIGR03067 family)
VWHGPCPGLCVVVGRASAGRLRPNAVDRTVVTLRPLAVVEVGRVRESVWSGRTGRLRRSLNQSWSGRRVMACGCGPSARVLGVRLGAWVVAATVFGGIAGIAAEPTSAVDAVAADRQALRGNWRMIELHVDGQRTADEEARRFTVVNAGDGGWSLLRDGGEFIRGTSTIDPAATPKAIDFIATDPNGERQEYHGIYEPGDPIRRLCFGRPGRPRPVAFTSTADDEQLLIVFERE